MATAVLNWNQKTIPERIIRCKFITKKTGENGADFVTPNPPLLEVEDAIEQLLKATVDALAGGYELTYAKNAANEALHSKMVQLQSYVQNISGGNEGILLKSGFELKKVPTPNPAPGQVENLSAIPSLTQGEILLNWDVLKYTKVYQVEMWTEAENGDGFWNPIATTTKSKFTQTDLATGTVYRFRVAGIGNDDAVGPYSQEASSVAP